MAVRRLQSAAVYRDFLLPPLPANLDAVRGPERRAQQIEQMVRRATVLADDVERLGRDVVVLIVPRFLFEGVDQRLQIVVGDFSEQGVRVGVVEIDHRPDSTTTAVPYASTSVTPGAISFA